MEQFLNTNMWLVALLVLWTLPWKVVALWKSARNSHTVWFIVLLVVNTLAILEIIYIFGFSKKKRCSCCDEKPVEKIQ
jgi:magnesium-transporting ATPase (P-type)